MINVYIFFLSFSATIFWTEKKKTSFCSGFFVTACMLQNRAALRVTNTRRLKSTASSIVHKYIRIQLCMVDAAISEKRIKNKLALNPAWAFVGAPHLCTCCIYGIQIRTRFVDLVFWCACRGSRYVHATFICSCSLESAPQFLANATLIADKPFPTLTRLVFKIRLNLYSTLFKKVRQKSF